MAQMPLRRAAMHAYDGYRRLTRRFAQPSPWGGNSEKPRRQKLLYIVDLPPSSTGTLRETIEELMALSAYRWDLLNLHGYLPVDPELDYNRYDGILFHNAIAYTAEILARTQALRKQPLADYQGLKAVMKQDEHYKIHQVARWLGENRFDLVLTLCGAEQFRKFYPPEMAGEPDFLTFLTGYVPEHFCHLPYRAETPRTIDVGYRGSRQPLSFGAFTHEKQTIASDFLPHALRRGLTTNISSRWEDRIMGNGWLAFLGNCKGQLGIESGGNLVDWEGEAEALCLRYRKRHPRATDAEILARLAPFEGNASYRFISPRHFEAAACFSQQILYEGEYQGIFRANEHYLPLKRDYSNADEVIDRLLDDKERAEMTGRAFEEIIRNPEYSFKTFVERFDQKLAELFAKKGI